MSKKIDVSVDQLLKGDVEQMGKNITDETKTNISKMNFYATSIMITFAIIMVSTPIMALQMEGLWFLLQFAFISAVIGIIRYIIF